MCLGLLALTGSEAAFMLTGGNTLYDSPTYALPEQMPGGMRTWGLVLAALWGATLYGYGKQRAGHGAMLRRRLAALASWWTLWLLMVAGTFVEHWRIYEANAIPELIFLAWLSVLVGRATSPDRSWG